MAHSFVIRVRLSEVKMGHKSGNYNGKAYFDYEIERYKDKKTSAYLTIDEVEDLAHNQDYDWVEENYEYVTLSLDIEGTSYFTQGKYYGPSEDCYPDEGETEITSILYGKEDWDDKITKHERDYIIDMIAEHAQEDYDGDPDVDEDRDYDIY